jgi:hypothetical protein
MELEHFVHGVILAVELSLGLHHLITTQLSRRMMERAKSLQSVKAFYLIFTMLPRRMVEREKPLLLVRAYHLISN